MSAFGNATEFFDGTGDFSFASFDLWMGDTVLTPKSAIVEEVAGWLPSAIFETDALGVKRNFVRAIADSLLRDLTQLRDERLGPTVDGDDSEADASDDEAGTLLDLCFDYGLLPSYAFPTDLCSFVIQEWDRRQASWRLNVAERPQLAKVQTLSEYAPGRLIVVNKKTYRVGGIFIDGPPSAAPASALFATPRSRCVGSGQFKRFLTGPRGCEITGVTTTPDLRTMFVNIQHPGEPASERNDPATPTAISSWPFVQRPRSSTVVIRKNDGGIIGT